MRICFATHNANKLKEVGEILGDLFEVVGLTAIGCTEEIPETGSTLEENSQIKAEYVFLKYGIRCFADDTGLEVETLNNEPGVYSARYAGEPADNQANMQLLLSNLEGKKNRRARFRTVITLFLDGKFTQFEGEVKGKIITEFRGTKGFGYDPVFIPDGFSQTFAEMTPTEKNAISHRGRAIQKLAEFLKG